MNTIDLQTKINEHHQRANAFYNNAQYPEAIFELEQAQKYTEAPEDKEILQQNIQTIAQTMQEQAMQDDSQYIEDEGPEHQNRLLLITLIVGAICLTSVAWKCYEIYSTAQPQTSQTLPVKTPQNPPPIAPLNSVNETGSEATSPTNSQTNSIASTNGAIASGPSLFIKGSGVNLRENPSTSAKAVTSLSKGDQVQVVNSETKEANGYSWRKIQTSDMKVGWIASTFLRQEEAATVSTSDSEVAPTDSSSSQRIAGSNVSLRSEPSTKGELLTRLSRNTEAKVLSDKTVTADGYIWSKIETDSGTGWIAAKFLK